MNGENTHDGRCAATAAFDPGGKAWLGKPPAPPAAAIIAPFCQGSGSSGPCFLSLGNRLFSIIQAAGWPIWPLLLCSIAALALVIERLNSLREVRVAPPKLLDEVLELTRKGLPNDEVLRKLADNSVLGGVLAAGIRTAAQERGANEAQLRRGFESAGRAAIHRLERYLNALGTIASAAPLLGLLGTVVGMIEIFGAQSPTGGNSPELLAHGISVALYNTAFGLIIAIPSLMFYRYFRGRVDAFVLDLELAAERLLPQLLRGAKS
jgi:biopolymer transport protein ExbB